jgi:hypothetical protein
MQPTEILSAEFTRLQWMEIKKALQTRKQFVNKGTRLGTASVDDVRMLEALIQDIRELLKKEK